MVQACTTPRDDRIRMLAAMPQWLLIDRYIALGALMPRTTYERWTPDELREVILDAETELGLVTR